jgi:hypothetical protein
MSGVAATGAWSVCADENATGKVHGSDSGVVGCCACKSKDFDRNLGIPHAFENHRQFHGGTQGSLKKLRQGACSCSGSKQPMENAWAGISVGCAECCI